MVSHLLWRGFFFYCNAISFMVNCPFKVNMFQIQSNARACNYRIPLMGCLIMNIFYIMQYSDNELNMENTFMVYNELDMRWKLRRINFLFMHKIDRVQIKLVEFVSLGGNFNG